MHAENNRQWNHPHITAPTQRQQCPLPPQSGDGSLKDEERAISPGWDEWLEFPSVVRHCWFG